MRGTSFIVLLAALLLGEAGPARADYPDRPVRVIVPFIAGSAPDVVARQAAQRLTGGLGQQFVIENKPGAAGNIGAEVAARAAPDGYTLMLLTSSHIQNKFLYARLNYDVARDFVPITILTRIPSLMVVPPSSPAKTVVEFVELAKANPGKLNYGSGGVGSLAHLSAEAFRFATGIDYVHVPYKGAPDIVLALLGNQVQVGFPTMPTAFRSAKQGSLRALAVTTLQRLPFLPQLPTVAESGLPRYQSGNWYGIMVPAKTPRETVVRVRDAVVAALNEPTVKKRLADIAYVPVGDTSEVFAAFVKSEIGELGKLVQQFKLTAD